MAPRVLRTNEYEETVSALEFAVQAAHQLGTNVYQWKWVVLGFHSALQGLMVLALRGGNGLAALPENIEQAWLRAYRSGEPAPRERLDNFLNLYRKIKGKRMLQFVQSKIYVPAGNEDLSMKKLNQLRNEFAHFLPRTWYLDLTGLPSICLDCLSVGEFLVEQSGNIMWPKGSQRIRVEKAIHPGKLALEAATTRFSS